MLRSVEDSVLKSAALALCLPKEWHMVLQIQTRVTANIAGACETSVVPHLLSLPPKEFSLTAQYLLKMKLVFNFMLSIPQWVGVSNLFFMNHLSWMLQRIQLFYVKIGLITCFSFFFCPPPTSLFTVKPNLIFTATHQLLNFLGPFLSSPFQLYPYSLALIIFTTCLLYVCACGSYFIFRDETSCDLIHNYLDIPDKYLVFTIPVLRRGESPILPESRIW